MLYFVFIKFGELLILNILLWSNEESFYTQDSMEVRLESTEKNLLINLMMITTTRFTCSSCQQGMYFLHLKIKVWYPIIYRSFGFLIWHFLFQCMFYYIMSLQKFNLVHSLMPFLGFIFNLTSYFYCLCILFSCKIIWATLF